MAVLEAVDDEAGGVAVDRPIRLDAGGGQHGRPCAFDRAVRVELHLPVFELGLLAHDQRCLTLGCQRNKKVKKIHN